MLPNRPQHSTTQQVYAVYDHSYHQHHQHRPPQTSSGLSTSYVHRNYYENHAPPVSSANFSTQLYSNNINNNSTRNSSYSTFNNYNSAPQSYKNYYNHSNSTNNNSCNALTTFRDQSVTHPSSSHRNDTFPVKGRFNNEYNNASSLERYKLQRKQPLQVSNISFQQIDPSWATNMYSSYSLPYYGQNSYCSNGSYQDVSDSSAHDLQFPRPEIIQQQNFQTSDRRNYNNSITNNKNKIEKVLGCTGLFNLGNTCYMNSILQCLSHTRVLLDYCLNQKYKDDMKKNKSKSKGILIKALADVLKEMWLGKMSIAPTDFRKKMLSSIKCFDGLDQEDAQEFLMFLLQGLSEDVCKDNNIKKAYSVRLFIAKRVLLLKLADMFMGQLRSVLTCDSCKNTSNTFDPILGLSLSIPSVGSKDRVLLTECLKHYFRDEVLVGDERAKCDHCQMKKDAKKSLFIQKFPKILIIRMYWLNLKRFSNNCTQKITKFVEYPVERLDLKEFTTFSANVSYSLYAVVQHFGLLGDGHYTASIQNANNNLWYYYDDDLIRQKRARRISGDPVHEVVVQGPVDGLATGTPLYSVAVQGTIDGRTTCRPRGWRFGTWNVGTLTGRSLEVVEELQRRMVDVAALQEIRWKGEGTRVEQLPERRIVNQHAYILFYKLEYAADEDTSLKMDENIFNLQNLLF
ncbi:hypothetical protein HELRODRAFT_171628 [Helobdella robusta]|uniref:Ubiquitin carboxyl-terminal hydrolase n=1 Tax=Helobdella robusta TaxID=6412 RepID=T1F4H3_HELRO|nr:hypothetical protein HELRODRAFT_171628 [Helobdella robusta]ESO05268.1 hypothetical protein HELRODRAFT_171628 [Helobdella robusta]